MHQYGHMIPQHDLWINQLISGWCCARLLATHRDKKMLANHLLTPPLLLLLLKVLSLATGPGQCSETYYVIPADEPPNCPGYPCLSLNEYLKNIDLYFSSDVVNVTMYFVPGVHISDTKDTTIRGLETFEMTGIERPEGVFVCFNVLLSDINVVSITSLTLSAGWGCTLPRLSFANVSTVIIKSVTGGQANSKTVTTPFKNINTFDVDCTLFPLSNTIAVSGEACPGVIAAYGNITVTGDMTFANRHETALTAYDSLVTLSGKVSFVNNTGTKGGAMALYSSILYIARNTTVYFHNNIAREVGGAIYVSETYNPYTTSCFYQLLNYVNSSEEYKLKFENNKAEKGGDHIYGVNMESSCAVAYYKESPSGWIGKTITSYQAMSYYFTFVPEFSLSAISSDPRGICLCDASGRPRCAGSISDIYQDRSVSPGETFTLSVVIVGGSFGTTTGTVYADFLPLESSYSHAPSLKGNYQHAQWITNHNDCFKLQYTVYSQNSHELLYLTSISVSQSTVWEALNRRGELEADIADYNSRGVISNNLLISPLFLNITLLPCPPGFVLRGDPPSCDCYMYIYMQPELLDRHDVNCSEIGVISWNGPLWIGTQGEMGTLEINVQCPSDYCEQGPKTVDFRNTMDTQCSFNRAGRLCGGCKESYSLAIGSSNCIYCPNNNNVALLIFFAAAGLLLVFFISALNLTVTQGWINGLIFYANIVWAYQDILFQDQAKPNSLMLFGKTFIAWLNLDFGIQTCFFVGLTAFWKTWLQYVFPVYTAGLFFIGLRYSSNLSKLFGGRSVPTLATLLFLTSTKLLRTIITSLQLSHLTNYPSNLTTYVWSIDGNLEFGHFPHITLLLAAIASLLLLWLPYTMLLFLMQWLRRISHSKTSRWITKYKPVFDAYFAPLKDKHHYWFGVLLLTRGVLLLVSSLTANINPAVSLFLLLATATLLLCYMNHMQVYKKNSVLMLESAFLINLVLLVGGMLYYYRDTGNNQKAILVYVSIAVAFIKFCGIIIWSLVQVILRYIVKRRQRLTSMSYNNVNSEDKKISQQEVTIHDSSQFRDSILEDAPLFYKKHPTY